MELNNITSFNNFKNKKIYEADFTHSFSNDVGFAKSLVGRAVFSLFRYFKMGIDTFRMEFLKRELENELFAGVLRYLANSEYSREDTEEQVEDNTRDEDQGQSKVEDYDKIKTYIDELVKLEDSEKLRKIETLKDEEKKKLLKVIENDIENNKIKIDVNDIKDSLEKINNILQDLENENKTKDWRYGYFSKLKITLENKLKTKVTESLIINEKVGSVMNKKLSIKQIYGDRLPDGKKFSDFNLDDVDWDDLLQKCKKNPQIKKDIAFLVNKEALKDIQRTAARMIYHTKSTPSWKGTTPETGGNIDTSAETLLANRWKKVVHKVLSLFAGVMIVDSNENDYMVDPFRLLKLDDAYKDSGTGGSKGETKIQEEYDKVEFSSIIKSLLENGLTSSGHIKLNDWGFVIIEQKYAFISKLTSLDTGTTTSVTLQMYPVGFEKIKEAIKNKKFKDGDIYKNYKITDSKIFDTINIKDNQYYITIHGINDVTKDGLIAYLKNKKYPNCLLYRTGKGQLYYKKSNEVFTSGTNEVKNELDVMIIKIDGNRWETDKIK
jgi:hypothetical protein